jgi:hypothetical protein
MQRAFQSDKHYCVPCLAPFVGIGIPIVPVAQVYWCAPTERMRIDSHMLNGETRSHDIACEIPGNEIVHTTARSNVLCVAYKISRLAQSQSRQTTRTVGGLS